VFFATAGNMQLLEHPVGPAKKGRVIKSAFDSESFEADGNIHVDGLVGSATISPSGRDVALAS
jgi:WD repeat-containing protein 59